MADKKELSLEERAEFAITIFFLFDSESDMEL